MPNAFPYAHTRGKQSREQTQIAHRPATGPKFHRVPLCYVQDTFQVMSVKTSLLCGSFLQKFFSF